MRSRVLLPVVAVLADLALPWKTAADPSDPVEPNGFTDTSTVVFTLPAGENDVRTAAIDPGLDGYFGIGPLVHQQSGVVKMRLADFAWVGGAPVQPSDLDVRSSVMDPTTHHAYFGSGDGRVLRFFGLSQTTPLTLGPGEVFLYCAAIDPAGGFAYFGTSTQPGRVVKIRLSDFTRVGAITLEPGEDFLRSAVLDAAGGFAFFGTSTQPGKVVKIRLSDFTRAGAVTLDPGEDQLRSAVLDAAGGHAYFGTFTSPGRVVKIRLSDFTRVGALPLDPGEDLLSSAVLDPASGYAAFGTLTSPGIVARVRLSDFTRAGTLTLAPGQDNLQAAAFDPTSGLAYFGTGTSPGMIVRLDLGDRIGTVTGVVSSSSPALRQVEFTLTATVSAVSGGGTPTGTIEWYRGDRDGAHLGTSSLVGGVASLTMSSLSAGPNLIKAVYSGDGVFSPSIGTVPQLVLVPSSTGVTSSLNPSTVGQAVTFTVRVACTDGLYVCFPEGASIQLKVDGASFGPPLGLVDSSARVTTSSLTAGTHEVTAEYTPGPTDYFTPSSGTLAGGQVVNGTPPLSFYTLTPCRAVDTRDPGGDLGGPALQPAQDRAFDLAGTCGIPPAARALSLNVTITSPTADGFLTVHAGGSPVPLASTINFEKDRTRANNAVVYLKGDGSGSLAIFNGSTGTVHVIVDVNGYFQ